MKHSFSLSSWIGFGVTSLLGTLLHFLFDLTGGSVLVAPFSAVNESTFEHMKLLFWPLFLFAVVQYFFFREEKGFWCIKLRGALLGLILIPTLFYTLNGVFGKTPDYINISIFFIATGAVFLYESHLFEKGTMVRRALICFSLFLFVGILLMIGTFSPLSIPLFRDPLTGSYGYQSIPR